MSMTNTTVALPEWLNDLTGQGIVITDAALRIRAWNHWMEQQSGYRIADVLDCQLLDVYPELVTRGFEQYYHQALAGKVSVFAQRLHGYLLPMPATRDFRTFEHMQQTARIGPLIQGGQVVGTTTVIDDVTERVTREAELRRLMAQEQAARGQLAFLAEASGILAASLDYETIVQQVQERTSALVAANAALQAEIREHKVTQQMRQLLLHQLIATQEEERRHIARELHDQMGQDITALLLAIKAIQNAVSADPSIAGHVSQMQMLALRMNDELHTLALQLHPPGLTHLGLATTLANHLEEWSARALVPVDFDTTGLDGVRLSPTIEIVLYRVAQESLTNILKHAQARHVSLILQRRTEALLMIVEDNGVGFDITTVRRSAHAGRQLGLIGMQERVAQVDGTLTIESEPGHGTTIIVGIPWANAVMRDSDERTSALFR
jgi:signal transduction histidine kinase